MGGSPGAKRQLRFFSRLDKWGCAGRFSHNFEIVRPTGRDEAAFPGEKNHQLALCPAGAFGLRTIPELCAPATGHRSGRHVSRRLSRNRRTAREGVAVRFHTTSMIETAGG